MSKRRLRVGIISRKNLDSLKSISAQMLFRNVSKVIESRFNSRYLFFENYRNQKEQKKEFNKFVSSCDLALELAPTRMFESEDKTIPIVFFALGFMSNPFNFFSGFYKRLHSSNSILFSSKSDFEIFKILFPDFADEMGYILPFPLDVDKFKPQGKRKNRLTRKKFSIPDDSPLLLYAGRINIQKNIHTLLKIFKELIKTFPKARLCIAGAEDNCDFLEFDIKNHGYAEYIKNKCYEYGIANKVIMPGQLEREELISLYSSADIFINCTFDYYENFGYSQVEAMACQTPVICTEWGGLKDTIVHGRTGYHMPTIVTNNGVKVDWQSGLKYLKALLDNRKKLLEMSKEARKYVKANYSFDKFSKGIERVFKDSIRRRDKKKPIKNLSNIKKNDKAFMDLFMEYMYNKESKGAGRKYNLKNGFYKRNYNQYRFFATAYSSASCSRVFREEASLSPYFLNDVTIAPKYGQVFLNDPIWPRKYRLKKWELDALSLIDAKKSIRQIYSDLKRSKVDIKLDSVMGLCERFRKEGLISFLNN